MKHSQEYLKLIKPAQLGDRESVDSLTQLVQPRIYAHIYRLTLDEYLAQDLCQETLLTMIQSLKNLRNPHRFWPWLLRTALGKVQHHYRDQRRGGVQMSTLNQQQLSQLASSQYNDGLNLLQRKEMCEAVFAAMKKLKLRYRNILLLRCFEQMPYAEIAALNDSSELQARVLFFRAKHSLQRQLSHSGVRRGLLLTTLALFGKITAPAQAASAPVAVTAATTKVGLVAAIIGAAGTTLGLATATAIITGAALAVTQLDLVATSPQTPIVTSQQAASAAPEPGFQYPSALVGAHDADNSGWEGTSTKEKFASPKLPQELLVGPPPPGAVSVTLPPGHWVELRFPHPIVDGPGPDIILAELDAAGEQAEVYITDAAGNEHFLGLASSIDPPRAGRTTFDIAGLSLPFTPCAVRIVGMDLKGDMPGFDLISVRARIER